MMTRVLGFYQARVPGIPPGRNVVVVFLLMVVVVLVMFLVVVVVFEFMFVFPEVAQMEQQTPVHWNAQSHFADISSRDTLIRQPQSINLTFLLSMDALIC